MAHDDPTNQSQPNRRSFVIGSTAAAVAGLSSISVAERVFAEPAGEKPMMPAEPLVGKNQIVLFQGDSITDAGRDRSKGDDANSANAMGKGYAWMAASQVLVESPDAGLKIYNRGISGDKVFQLADRWQQDCLDLKPDVLSILVGVNDFAHVFKHGYEGTLEKYESDYHALIKRTKDAMPKIRLIICEPFILNVGIVDDTWIKPFAEYRAAAMRVAKRAQASFVPFQEMFDRAVKFAAPEHWAGDGIHPSTFGAALMARWWLNAVGA
jgi:lysophospholipase L1-like esterase